MIGIVGCRHPIIIATIFSGTFVRAFERRREGTQFTHKHGDHTGPGTTHLMTCSRRHRVKRRRGWGRLKLVLCRTRWIFAVSKISSVEAVENCPKLRPFKTCSMSRPLEHVLRSGRFKHVLCRGHLKHVLSWGRLKHVLCQRLFNMDYLGLRL